MANQYRVPTLPSPSAVARELCSMGAEQPGPMTFERDALMHAAEFLAADPPLLDAAIGELREAVEHAFCAGYVEDRPQSWLAAAALKLLTSEGRHG